MYKRAIYISWLCFFLFGSLFWQAVTSVNFRGQQQVYFSSCNQSEMYGNRKCELAYDNQTDRITYIFCTHTEKLQNPYWMGFFDRPYRLVNITLYNRNENQERLNDFEIITDEGVCANYSGKDFSIEDFVCNATTTSVKIQLMKKEYMSVCQVQAFILEIPAIESQQIKTTPNYESIYLTWTASPLPWLSYIVDCGNGEVYNTTGTSANCSQNLESAQNVAVSLTVQQDGIRSVPTIVNTHTLIYAVSTVTHVSSTHDRIFFTWTPSQSKGVSYRINCGEIQHKDVEDLYFSCSIYDSDRSITIDITAFKAGIPDDSETYEFVAKTTPDRRSFPEQQSKFTSCSQSSIHNSLDCKRAMDGNRNPDVTEGSCAHTENVPLPSWWKGPTVKKYVGPTSAATIRPTSSRWSGVPTELRRADVGSVHCPDQ